MSLAQDLLSFVTPRHSVNPTAMLTVGRTFPTSSPADPCKSNSVLYIIPARNNTMATRSNQPNPSHVGMKKWESGLLRLWRCPRRPRCTRRGPNPETLFACTTCGFSCVCRKCARSCHPGHDIRPCTRT